MRLPLRQQLRCYALALALALGAVTLQWLVRPWVGPRIPFLFMLPALVLASTWAGRAPGLMVLVIGLLNAAFWMPPTGSLVVADEQDQLSLVIYVLFALLLVQFGAHLRGRAERAQASEERLLLAVEDTGIGIFDIDLAAQTVQISPGLARLARMSVPVGPIALADWLDRLPPEAVAESRAALIAELRALSPAYERELLLASADGDPRWMLLRVHLVWDGQRAVRLRGVAVDITDRKLVDAQLKRTRGELSQQVDDLHRLHELSSGLNEPGTLQARLQMILQTLAAFHGTDRGLVSLFEDGLLAVEAELGFSEAGLALLAQARRGEGAGGLALAQRQRVVIEDAQQDSRFLQFREFARLEGLRAMHSTPLISERGEVLGTISVHFDHLRKPTERERALADICARKAAIFIDRDRARDALAQTQDRFEAVLEAAAVPFCVLTPQRDERGRISDFVWTYLNAAAAAVVGQPRHELLGRAVLEVLPGYWQHDATAFKHFVTALERGEVQQFESGSGRPGGHRGSFQYIASPMQDAVSVWFSDISERKRNEQLLHEADRRKDEFLATLAHELRNPLAPIRQAALLSKAPMATEAQKRWSHAVIERQVQHMALLLDDLLDISRITRGALSLRIDTADLADVIDAAIETARPLIDAKRHKLAVSLPDQPVRFDADVLRISQVVANLLVNAARYTDAQGRLRLVASLVDGQLEIVVSDSGIGIAAESLHEVFQMFTQLRGAGERSSGGLGIGLALTRGLVALHGGEVFARSAGLGQGSSFTVRLPLRQGQVHPCAEPAGAPVAAVAVVKPRKVLIADDNVDAAESLALLMQLQGHQVTLAFDGRQAFERFQCDEADVCLLDIGMPHLNGNEVAQAIRRLPGGARPLLVAITGWGQASDRSQSLAAGFDHHLTKPVDPERLAQLLAEPAVLR